MKLVKEMPKNGQFVVFWAVSSGDIFSATIDFVGYIMRSYNASEDDWELEHGYSEEFFDKVNATYIVKD